MRAAGLTVTSMVTSDPELYNQTIEFYKKLGFRVNAEWSRRATNTSTVTHGHDSLREATLVLYGVTSGQDASIQLRLAANGEGSDEASKRIAKLEESHKTCDWRDIFPATMIPVQSLDEAAFQGVSHQSNPPIGTAVDIFVVDPLGNLVGFTVATAISTAVQEPAVGSIAPPATSTGDAEDSNGDAVASAKTDSAKIDRPFQEEKVFKDKLYTKDDKVPASTVEVIVDETKKEGPRKRIGVLTSGGDAPGMNAAVRAVVRNGIHRGCEVFAVYEGYEGLVQGGDMIKRMSWDDVRGYLSIGGTSIGTARCMAFREREGRLRACHNMIKSGIDALVVCGGDGSLTGADLFRSDWPGLIAELHKRGDITDEQLDKHRHLYICGLVGSIDNDMALTDCTIGAYSSLDRICTNIEWVEATAESHSRAFVIEVMGRHCGWLALMAAIATRADYVFIPEMPPKAGVWIEKMQKVVKRHRAAGRRRSIVIVAEGAIDTDLKPIHSKDVAKGLSDIGLDTRVTTFGHVQRGGTAVAFDRMMATMQGSRAVDAILESTPETPSPMIGIKENKIVTVELMKSVAETKKVAEAIDAGEFERARSLRDSEFNEHLRNYLIMSNSDRVEDEHAAEKKLNVAIVAVGAPAGGMNAAVAAAASYCFARGHKPYTIHNGWSGLARHESVREISWLEVETMFSQGGCEIGTNRSLPDVDYGMIAYYFGKYQFDGLIIIGGFEAYKSLHMLDEARGTYPSFRIPMVCLPATISNNVPGTEYSLGTDTCLNALVEYCDVVKQSAASTRRRVFVVEVQGGNSGFVAAYCGLITGAHAVYVPEDGITLSQMAADIRHLRHCFAEDQGRQRAGRLVIRNECASTGFSTVNLTQIFETESHGKFDAREAVPGHLQQGGVPSPMDHIRATRQAIRCVEFLENTKVEWHKPESMADTAVVIGVVGTKVELTPVRYLWEYETEVKYRRSTKIHWLPLLEMANLMTGRPVPKAGELLVV